nr:discoidin domain-containing protein [Modestobacter versicolor]
MAPAASAADCPLGSTVNVVAHPDDDLFFINPAIARDVTAGRCSTTVFATSGDGGDRAGYSQGRELGLQAAYADMAGVANSWTAARPTFAGKAVTVMTLTARPTVQLVYLRLPDGNIDGSGFASAGYGSLEKLYRNQVSSLSTIDAPQQTYTRSALVATLGAALTAASPTAIRTMDDVHDYGDGDHSDHYTVARLTAEARAQYLPSVRFNGYLGYPGGYLPENVTGTDRAAKLSAFEAYAPYDSAMCPTLEECRAAGRPDALWLLRSYLTDGGSDTTPDPGTEDGNAAAAARVTASSQNTETGQLAAKAVDGTVDGWPGDHTAEWATQGGGAGSWLELNWGEGIGLDHVTLFDRPNTSDRITGGTLTFSDGSTVAVPALADDGSAVTVTFTPRTTTSVRLTITSVSSTTSNVGLAEIQAWTGGGSTTPPPTTTPPTTTPPTTTPPTTTPPTTTPPTSTPSANVAGAATVTASSQNTETGQLASKAVDGVVDGWPGTYTAEWATQGGGSGSWLQLAWAQPRSLDRVVLHDRPNTSDRITGGRLTFSDGSTVAVPSLPDNGTALTVTFAARSTTSLRLDVTAVSTTTSNVGLAELQAWTVAGTPTTSAPTTTAPTTSAPPTTTAPTTTAPTTSAPPTTTAPTTSAPPTTTPPTTTAPTTTTPPTTTAPTTSVPATTNVARSATVTASSQNSATGQLASKAVDGVVDGYPGVHTAEWATQGIGAGSWLQLGWASPVRVGRVVLHDRPNPNDQVTGATITFSDGTSVTVPVLDNAGGAVTVTFPARSTSTLRVTITSVSGTTESVGLAELLAYGS